MSKVNNKDQKDAMVYDNGPRHKRVNVFEWFKDNSRSKRYIL